MRALLLLPLLLAPARDPWFVNVAKDAGLAGKPAQRAVFVEIDGDGRVDCVLDRRRVYLQTEGAWKDVTDESKLNVPRPADTVAFGDVDNDGDMDCFSGRYCDFERIDGKTGKPAVADDGQRSLILLNDGKGHFAPVKDSGVEKDPATTCAAAFVDYDADGKLDLFVGNWYRNYGATVECYPSRLYRGNGDGTFADVTEKMGLPMRREAGERDSCRPVYGIAHGDWNNDGRQDLWVCSYGRQWNLLLENAGDRFVDRGAATTFDGDDDRTGEYPAEIKRAKEPEFRCNGNTFDCAIADVDNDGDLDCFLGEITHWWAGPSSDFSSILWNEGREKGFRFKRDAASIKRVHDGKQWNQGDLHAAWLDADNDGLLDLAIASSDYPDRQELRLYRQKPDHSFEEVTKEAGFDWEGCGGISVADFDRDGDLDILAGQSFMRLPAERTKDRVPEAALFRNDIGNRKKWVTLTLSGTAANRAAIGARVTVRAGGVTQMREVRGGEGHAGHQNPPELHFGLGDAAEIDEVVVRWPDKDGTTQNFKGVASAKRYRLKQGGSLE
jgi:hypothetical protein